MRELFETQILPLRERTNVGDGSPLPAAAPATRLDPRALAPTHAADQERRRLVVEPALRCPFDVRRARSCRGRSRRPARPAEPRRQQVPRNVATRSRTGVGRRRAAARGRAATARRLSVLTTRDGAELPRWSPRLLSVGSRSRAAVSRRRRARGRRGAADVANTGSGRERRGGERCGRPSAPIFPPTCSNRSSREALGSGRQLCRVEPGQQRFFRRLVAGRRRRS